MQILLDTGSKLFYSQVSTQLQIYILQLLAVICITQLNYKTFYYHIVTCLKGQANILRYKNT